MEESSASDGVRAVVSVIAGAGLILLLACYTMCCFGRQKKKADDNNGPMDLETSGKNDFDHGGDVGLVASSAVVSDDDACGTVDIAAEIDDSVPASLHSPVGYSEKKRFLDWNETLTRARYLFPGLLNTRHIINPKRNVQRVVLDLLKVRLNELQEDQEQFDLMMQPENAVDLCLALGLNETVVRRRYEAVGNLKRELNIASKTPTLVSVRHLVYRLGVNNPYGNPEDIDGVIRETYRGKDWLAYLGVKIEKSEPQSALESLKNALDQANFSGCYMHGTTATVFSEVDKDNGIMDTSAVSKRLQQTHDFGPGLYCFKGRLSWALSFAIDRCWPLPEEDGMHNPGVILFPKPRQFNREHERELIYDVDAQQPFADEFLLEDTVMSMTTTELEEFNSRRKKWEWSKKEELNSKEFVRLARVYRRVPPGKQVFHGWLHDCMSTQNTDRCEEPRIDVDLWEQYCVIDPVVALGRTRLFIELDVDWNQWTNQWTGNILGDSTTPASNILEAEDAGKQEAPNAGKLALENVALGPEICKQT